MRDVWIIDLLSLLTVSGIWSMEGVNCTVSVNSHTTPTLTSQVAAHEQGIIATRRNENVRKWMNVNLTCRNSNWTTMMYIIWKINLDGINCAISLSREKPPVNTCNDGKALINTTNGISLHIPKFSFRDEGLYKCESVYTGGQDKEEITVSIIAPPKVTARIERTGSRLEAVCLAEGGKPRASVSWINTWNSSVLPQIKNGSEMWESRLILPEGFTAKDNLSCVVTHPYFNTTDLVKISEESALTPWHLLSISVVTITISVVMVTLGGLYFTRSLLCRTSDTTSSESKAAQPQDYVEEVEPYASYVQRVNSIYNSSADLFT